MFVEWFDEILPVVVSPQERDTRKRHNTKDARTAKNTTQLQIVLGLIIFNKDHKVKSHTVCTVVSGSLKIYTVLQTPWVETTVQHKYPIPYLLKIWRAQNARASRNGFALDSFCSPKQKLSNSGLFSKKATYTSESIGGQIERGPSVEAECARRPFKEHTHLGFNHCRVFLFKLTPPKKFRNMNCVQQQCEHHH